MAAVIQADLWRLGQAAPGSFIAFSEVSYQDAVAAMAPVSDYLAKLRATADLVSSALSGSSTSNKSRVRT